MKAITLYQPWASLIAEGPKTVETRSWPAPQRFTGQRIAIHAGARKVRITSQNDPQLYADIRNAHGSQWQESIPAGAVVATALLAGCFRVTGWKPGGLLELEGWGEGGDLIAPDNMGDFRRGRWLWVLRDIQRLDPPKPAKGQRMLWDWTPEEGALT